jgi:UBA/TS-N domain
MEGLLEMGFDETAAKSALEAAGGDSDLALSILLGDTDITGSSTGRPGASAAATNVGGLDEDVIMLGISQYTFSEMGSSACTSIAVTGLISLLESLEREEQRLPDAIALSEMIVSGVMNYASMVGGSGAPDHLSVEEFIQLSPPETTRKIVQVGDCYQGLITDHDAFQKLAEHAEQLVISSGQPDRYIGIVITKPPETVCIVLAPPNARTANKKYIFFDSHSRPQFEIDGSYVVTTNELSGVLLRLRTIFPSEDIGGLDEHSNYMQMMYNSFDGTVFQLARVPS